MEDKTGGIGRVVFRHDEHNMRDASSWLVVSILLSSTMQGSCSTTWELPLAR